MLETITGSATMSYIPPQESLTGWFFAAFIGALWIITLILLDFRVRENKKLRMELNRIQKEVMQNV